jgi:putative endonuclease
MKLNPKPGPFRLPLGDRGEAAACKFLKKKGYDLIEKNYQCKLGEIDVIAKRGGRIAFIEVKTRTSAQYGAPQEAVNPVKQEKIFKIASWYLKEKRISGMPVAFDVVSVLWKEGQPPEITLIPDAFEKGEEPARRF